MNANQEAALQTAKGQLTMLLAMKDQLGNNPQYQQMVADAEGKVRALTPPPPPPPAAPPAPVQGNIEQRLANIEQGMLEIGQVIRQAAAPEISEAAQIGAMLLAAIGESLSPEDQQFVASQQNLGRPPAFLATQDCRDAASLFVSEWRESDARSKQ